MSADFNKPTVSSSYTTFPTEVRDNVSAVAKQDYSGASNIPTGTKRYNTSTKAIEQYNGSTWDAQEITNLADGAVSAAAKLASNVVTTAKILDSNVTTAKIADSNVTTAKIADGAITEAKLHDDAASRSSELLEAGILPLSTGTVGATPLRRYGSSTEQFFPISHKSMPKAGKVTHLSLNFDSAHEFSSGSVTVTLYKNLSSTGKTITISTGASQYVAISSESFVAGDRLALYVSASSYGRSSGSGHLAVSAWGHFTE